MFADSKARVHETLAQMRVFLDTSLGLSLRKPVTRVAPVTQGISFLGFRVLSLFSVHRAHS
ncbi:MAG: hypothetical protein FJZ47_21250 [Candidatus Tectomicrobia bacterium]|uniref:Uncharacterized protein n=1 Tax=Tectimicrobiota bacterium TaxID=2528274 RepID=A0A937W6E7_UNCTE|nr:hypothetical protein [Candidatus Tectomicrobia bacterium]